MAQNVNQYDKTVVLETSDGQVTVTGMRANSILARLNDSSRYWHFTQGDSEVYYNVNSAACGFCKVATLTYQSTLIDETECEDGIPNCSTTSVTVAPDTLTIGVGATGQLRVTTEPANQNVKWSSNDTTTVTVNPYGVVKGIKAGSATVTATDVTGNVSGQATVTVE